MDIVAIARNLYPHLDINNQSMISARGTISEMQFKCPICRDGGWITPRGPDGKPLTDKAVRCQCQAQADWERRQAAYLKHCELPAATEDRTFATFNAYKPALREALEAARDMVAGKINLLVLASGVDRGKTHLAIAICRSWLSKGKSAKYAYVPLLLDELRNGFKQDGDDAFDVRFRFYQTIGLLVLDDLGAEVRTAWAIEKLETIIDYRWINALPTVITTNCGMDEFTDRIRSRIARWNKSQIISLQGDIGEYSKYRKGTSKKA